MVHRFLYRPHNGYIGRVACRPPCDSVCRYWDRYAPLWSKPTVLGWRDLLAPSAQSVHLTCPGISALARWLPCYSHAGPAAGPDTIVTTSAFDTIASTGRYLTVHGDSHYIYSRGEIDLTATCFMPEPAELPQAQSSLKVCCLRHTLSTCI